MDRIALMLFLECSPNDLVAFHVAIVEAVKPAEERAEHRAERGGAEEGEKKAHGILVVTRTRRTVQRAEAARRLGGGAVMRSLAQRGR